MDFEIAKDESLFALDTIQESLEHTDMINSGVFTCDCTGCSNRCFESCADGFGPTD